MIFHTLMSNIFMLNYLIAILTTVYEEMLQQGDFAYKSNKYMYIERFFIPLQDQWGYTELVVHPAPMNYISSILLLTVFDDGLMRRSSEIVSKLIFWIENIYYVLEMLLIELVLAPFIYCRLIINIIRTTTIGNAIILLTCWILLGPFFLVFCIFNDMYFYSKILCDYREDDDAAEIKQQEDLMQDEIVICNEVLDTLRAIMNTLKYQKRKHLKKWEKKSPSPHGSPKHNQSTNKSENPLLV